MRVVVYHSECADGIMCAYLMGKAYNHPDAPLYDNQSTLMFPGQYSLDAKEEIFKFFRSLFKQCTDAGIYCPDAPATKAKCESGYSTFDDMLTTLASVDLLLTDFSFSRATVELLLENCHSVTLLDHHKSAIEDLQPLAEHPKFRMEMSTISECGAMIVDRYIRAESFRLGKGEFPVHPLLRHIDDYDRWTHYDERSMPLVTALYSYDFKIQVGAGLDYDFGEIGKALEKPVYELVTIGEHILRNKRKQAAKYVKGAWKCIEFGGSKIPVVNCPTDLASMVAGEIAELTGVAITYMSLPDRVIFSVRSRGEVDCAFVAKSLSGGKGGGHKGAAGFSLDIDETFHNAGDVSIEGPNSQWRKHLTSKK